MIFSIIIATYNRPEQLQICLESLDRLKFPKEQFEVIVVNDGGEDNLKEVLSLEKLKIQLSFYYQENQGCGGARNHGVQFAKGKYLHFTDDDCTLEENFLAKLLVAHTENNHVLVGGIVLNGLKDNIFAQASQDIVTFVAEFSRLDFKQIDFFTGNNISLLREDFLKLDGFDLTLPFASEDRDLTIRFLDLGYKLFYSSEMITFHFHNMNLKKFIFQQYNYGRGGYDFHKLHIKRELLNSTYTNFFSKLMIYPLKKYKKTKAFKILGLFICSQFFYFLGMIRQYFYRMSNKC